LGCGCGGERDEDFIGHPVVGIQSTVRYTIRGVTLIASPALVPLNSRTHQRRFLE